MRSLALVFLALCAACKSEEGALVVSISSSLELKTETDRLVVRVLSGMTVLEDESYTIGAPPLDRWPLVQQINRGPTSPDAVTVVAELRRAESNGTLLLVGYGAVDATLPKTGREDVTLEVPRACEDGDGDELGFGVGCRGLDCDDNAIDRPNPTPCDVRPDGGTPDAGADAAVDQPLCGDGAERCAADEVCIRSNCRRRCRVESDCMDRTLTCNTDVNACLCRGVPCSDDLQCRPNMCDHGCCAGI